MSHSSILVIGEDPEAQLAPFDENLELEPYVEFTREALIAKGREEIEKYRDGLYAEYLKDPEAYAEGSSNPAHLEYLAEGFPKKLEWTDEQVYADQITWYDAEDIQDDGSVLSTSNPKAKWDWFQIGGRWRGFFAVKPGAAAKTVEPHYSDIEADQISKGGHSEYKTRAEFDSAMAGRSDQLCKGDIDFDAMRAAARVAAGDAYKAFLAATHGTTAPVTWDLYRQQHRNITEARDAWANEPWIRALRAAHIFEDDHDYWCLSELSPEQAFTERAAARACIPFAVLVDGVWHERGRMGWFGFVDGETSQDEWNSHAQGLIDSAADDHLFTIVDVHI